MEKYQSRGRTVTVAGLGHGSWGGLNKPLQGNGSNNLRIW